MKAGFHSLRVLFVGAMILWLLVGPLHMAGHDQDHGKPCEICFHLSHQHVDIADTQIIIRPVHLPLQTSPMAPQKNYAFNVAAIFYELRGPPDQWS